MSRKVLMVATYGDFFAAFETNNIKILNEMGCEVHLCANWLDDRYNYKHSKLEGLDFKKINIAFERSPFALKNIRNYQKLLKLMKKEDYYLVDCHNAVIGVYARIAAKVNKVPKTMYTAHGFQFFRGGRKIDWIVYYPIEKHLSRMTDQLVVINNEDFELAKKFYAKKVNKIPGVGFNYKDFSESTVDKIEKKRELNIPRNAFVIISVGELSKRKNHEVIIKAISQLKSEHIYYVVAGEGERKAYLSKLSVDLGVQDRVKLLGYRSDIHALNEIADIAAFPSLREGLGIAALESLASGLPLISSNVQGIKDYSIDGVTGFVVESKEVHAYAEVIAKACDNVNLRKEFASFAKKKAKEFAIEEVDVMMKHIYNDILK